MHCNMEETVGLGGGLGYATSSAALYIEGGNLEGETMPEVIAKGGPMMYFIMACSVIAFAVVIERMLKLHSIRTDWVHFLSQMRSLVEKGDILGAVRICENTPGPIARICKAVLLKHDRPKAEIKEAAEDAAVHEIPVLERRLPILATIAHISPLLGLLGTVLGMIKAFHKIQELTAMGRPVDPGQLAAGIWEALITTAFGLLVAIPTFVAYNYLVNRANNIVTDMERSATDLVNLLVEEDRKSTRV